jgi:hypothetical protein
MASKSSTRVLTLIAELEAQIKKGTVKPEYLEELQQQLNDGSLFNNDKQYHQYAFELQALIYKAEDRPDELAKCVAAAVEQAGSIQKLQAGLLRTYARKDASIISVEQQTGTPTKSGPGKVSLLTEGEQRFLRHHGLEDMPDVDFLTRSVPIFAVMFVLSGGIYGSYWLYKNWQAVHEATDIRFSPLWRTLLSIIYIWPLFKVMVVLAKSRGFNPKHSGGALAAGYIATAFVAVIVELSIKDSWVEALGIQLATSLLYLFFLVMAQRAASFALSKRASPKPDARPINYVELLFVAVGLFFVLVSFSDYSMATLKSNGSTATKQTQTSSTKQ